MTNNIEEKITYVSDNGIDLDKAILNNNVNKVKELWDDYKKAVKSHGYGAETKQILIKIYSLTHRE